MSAEPRTWKDYLGPSRAARASGDSGGEADRDHSHDPDADLDVAGAWPEDVEVNYYAASSLTLPGYGSSGKSCGEYFPREFCGDEGHVNFGVSRCNGRGCSECWKRWCGSGARRITRRIQAYRHVQPHGLPKRIVHQVVSPPEGIGRTLVDWYDLVKQAYTFSKESGVRGGVAIPHAFRVKTHVKRAWRQHFNDATPDGYGIWKWIRENDKHWRDQVYYSPHVHIIGASTEVGNERDLENADGWVLRRVRTLENYGLTNEKSYDDLLGLGYYQLSHSSYEPDAGKQVVRWFGELAPAAFSPPEELSQANLDTIEAYTEEVQYGDHGPAEDDDDADCCDHCDSEDLHPIWHARRALQDERFCKKIGRTQQRRLSVAFEWSTGQLRPPPGLDKPRTLEDAEETFAHLVNNYNY